MLHIPRNYQNDLNDLICVYTPNQYFEIDNGKIVNGKGDGEFHSLGMLPMVEYKLNPERMGLFEPAIPVLDAINDLESNRLDGVAQFIQSIMVFTNCLVDKDALDQVKELGAMCLKSTSGLTASVSQIANELDQQQSQTLLDSMLNVYRSLTAMPSATGSENATSDNVGAVIVRNGWNHTEARAQQYENMFKYAERQSLSVMLKILRDTAGSKLMASDINIKLPRRQYDNQQSKVQIFAQMLSQSINPQLAFTTPGLFPDPQAAYEMSKPFLIAAGKLGEDGKAPKPHEQPKQDVTGTNVGNMADEQAGDANKETEGEQPFAINTAGKPGIEISQRCREATVKKRRRKVNDMKLNVLLGDAYKEGMTADEIISALEKVADPSAEVEKLRNAVTKANGEAAEYKKQLKAKRTDDENAAQEQADKLAEMQKQIEALTADKENLVKEKTLASYREKFVAQG